MVLRPYQQEAVDAAKPYVEGTKQGNPIIVLPTGSGKTWTLAYIIEHFVEEHFPKKVVVLSHVKEILRQNRATIEAHMGFSTAYYSASLGEKSTDAMIIVAGVQSLVRLKDEAFWNDVGLFIIDECHRVSNRETGSYRKLLARADAPCVGLTATPFRLGQGYLTDGKDALFTSICYNGGSLEKYNELVEQGYLTKIISKSTDTDLDVSKVKITGGDYNLKELSEAVDHNAITEAAVKETIKYGKKYKHWLVFAIDIEHAEHIAAEFNKNGVPAGVVHSKMEGSRDTVIEDFKQGRIRALVNVEVLTTGFDFPAIDLVVMLRPTQSPVIHVQTVGRGARVAPGKDHCLFLDFAGNTERLGPINNVYVRKKGERASKKYVGMLRTKICPKCGVYIPIQSKICEICNHKFIVKTKLRQKASKAEIVAKPIEDSGDNSKPRWLEVQDVKYSIHKIKGNTDAFRVQYYCGLMVISEWVFFGRKNYAGVIADNWIKWRLPPEIVYPQSMNDLMRVSCFLLKPKRIKVDFSGKFKDVSDYEF